MSEYNKELLDIKGIGPVRAKKLASMGINNIQDILYHFPRKYEDRSKITRLSELKTGVKCTVIVKIDKIEELKLKNKRILLKVSISDDSGSAQANWYNQKYLKNRLLKGMELIITGKTKIYNKQKEISVIDYEYLYSKGDITKKAIMPYYPSIDGLNQKFWRDLHRNVSLSAIKKCEDIFDQTTRKRYNICSIQEALSNLHFPADQDKIEQARKRMAFEEAFIMLMSLKYFRQFKINQTRGIKNINDHPQLEKFIAGLGFSLTNAQIKVWNEIKKDMEAEKTMYRLVQGDVGSGKTIIAALAIMKAIANGNTGILMAPTELLARQHAESFKKWYGPLRINVLLLTGSLKKEDRRQAIKMIQNNKADVIIGTQALLSDNITLDKAGVLVIDEQHRFGVRQRNILEQKGYSADVLVMSATPIPRTLNMVMYGDLDISVIDELPLGRKKIETICLKEKASGKLYPFILKQLQSGSLVYIVCPFAEGSELLDIANTEQIAAELKKILYPFRVDTLHGKMPAKMKEDTMVKFIMGEIKVLVCTTIIEVGVDIAAANIIIIHDAERFGIAQLHQLRGRVGRGGKQGYCILLTKSNDPKALKRLKTIVQNTNGFLLAEEDLKQRGPGEVLGFRQHGLAELKFADLYQDDKLISAVQNLANGIIYKDPLLLHTDNKLLSQRVNDMIKSFKLS